MTKFKGYVLQHGTSPVNGCPFVVIMTMDSGNTKTGNMCQVWILTENIHPVDAVHLGADDTVCGDCPHRKQSDGSRSCYVNVGQAPAAVWKSYKRGVYQTGDAVEMGRDRFVRVGTYGDPAAVPKYVWDNLLSQAKTWTAYTHQKSWSPEICMQSADTYEQAQEHWAAGRRTFRVIQDLADLDKQNETLCPASKEAGRRVQCTACKLCRGSSKAKSIAIVEH